MASTSAETMSAFRFGIAGQVHRKKKHHNVTLQ
jgi:hypothetical protein